MLFILGQIFSLASAICLAYSTFGKTKNKIVLWQGINATFYSLSNICLGGYSAVVPNILTVTRNFLQVKGKLDKYAVVTICILMTVVSLFLNNNGILGLLPITASVSYTVLMYLIKSVQGMQLAVVSNMLQWVFFDWFIKAYPSFTIDIVIIVLTMYNFLKNRKNKELKDELN